MSSSADMLDHWWWRPGWKVGRSFYTWHVTFDENPEVQSLLEHYSPTLERFPGLDPVGISGLHLTVQGVGFTDEVPQDDALAIASRAVTLVSKLEPFELQIGPAFVDPETVQTLISPLEGLEQIRNSIREAIGETWGPEKIPEKAEGFRPHVTLAYSNSSWNSEGIRSAIDELPPYSVTVTVSSVSLIDLNRDAKRYEWTEVARATLNG